MGEIKPETKPQEVIKAKAAPTLVGFISSKSVGIVYIAGIHILLPIPKAEAPKIMKPTDVFPPRAIIKTPINLMICAQAIIGFRFPVTVITTPPNAHPTIPTAGKARAATKPAAASVICPLSNNRVGRTTLI